MNGHGKSLNIEESDILRSICRYLRHILLMRTVRAPYYVILVSTVISVGSPTVKREKLELAVMAEISWKRLGRGQSRQVLPRYRIGVACSPEQDFQIHSRFLSRLFEIVCSAEQDFQIRPKVLSRWFDEIVCAAVSGCIDRCHRACFVVVSI